MLDLCVGWVWGERSKETYLPQSDTSLRDRPHKCILIVRWKKRRSSSCSIFLLLFGLIKVASSTVLEKGLICFLSPSLFALWPRPIPLSSHARYERLSDGGGESGRDVPFAEKRPFSAFPTLFLLQCWSNITSVLDTLRFLYACNLHVKFPSLSCSNGMSNSGRSFFYRPVILHLLLSQI